MVNYIPDRGDIVWLNFAPQAGKEVQKTRPALVISPLKYNQKTGLALLMPITSQIKNYPFEVLVKTKVINGAVLCDQIRSLDWRSREAKFITHIEPDLMATILAKFSVLLTD